MANDGGVAFVTVNRKEKNKNLLPDEIRQSLCSGGGHNRLASTSMAEETYDMRLVSAQEPQRAGLRCHRVILAAASPLLKQCMLDSPESELIYLDVDFRTLKAVLKFIYDVEGIAVTGKEDKIAVVTMLTTMLQVRLVVLHCTKESP